MSIAWANALIVLLILLLPTAPSLHPEREGASAAGPGLYMPDRAAAQQSCVPTHDDPPGPYLPDPPVRSSVGQGHVVTGMIRSARGCAPIAGAKLELWPEVDGQHRPADRAAVFADHEGRYRFESAFPGHIHMRVSAHGYATIFTNAYHPTPGQQEGRFDIVLRADAGCQPFEATGKALCGRFLEYWQRNGGLAQFGYPVSEELREASAEDGRIYTVQYFERAVFELHPENEAPGDVLLRRLGAMAYARKYPRGAPEQRPNRAAGSRLVAETGKRLGGRFLQYWQQNGGLARQGHPISDELQERSEVDGKTYTVQYFERAVFELHPENSPPYDVLLSHLGALRLRETHGRAAGTVSPGPAMAVARSCHSATLLRSGKVLIAGGMAREGVFTAGAEIYDPGTDSFSPAGDLLAPRACHTATLLADGRVLIAGGDGRSWLNSAEVYDPERDTFFATGAMNEPRSGHTATLLTNGKVLITGGFGGRLHASAELYDPATGRFTPAGSMSAGRSAHSATLLADGKVLLAGGGARGTVEASAELYDPATGRFSPTGQMPRVRYKHAAIRLMDGDVLLVGGSDSRDWRGRYAAADRYDRATGGFHPGAETSEARFKLAEALALLPDGRVLAAGGAALVEVYDPASAAFTAVGSVDTPRFYSTATALPDGRVLIAGGYDQGIAGTERTWIYGR